MGRTIPVERNVLNDLRFSRASIPVIVDLWLHTSDGKLYWYGVDVSGWSGPAANVHQFKHLEKNLTFDDLTEEEQYRVCEWMTG